MDVLFCEYFHQGASSITQTLVVVGSEEQVELASYSSSTMTFSEQPRKANSQLCPKQVSARLNHLHA